MERKNRYKLIKTKHAWVRVASAITFMVGGLVLGGASVSADTNVAPTTQSTEQPAPAQANDAQKSDQDAAKAQATPQASDVKADQPAPAQDAKATPAADAKAPQTDAPKVANEVKANETNLAQADVQAQNVDNSALKADIDTAKKATEAYIPSSGLATYTTASSETVQLAIDNANSVLGDKNATQANIDAAKQAIDETLAGLVETHGNLDVKADPQPNKDALDATFYQFTDLDETQYDQASYDSVNEEAKLASMVMGDESATQNNVDEANALFKDAFSRLLKADGSNAGFYSPSTPVTPSDNGSKDTPATPDQPSDNGSKDNPAQPTQPSNVGHNGAVTPDDNGSKNTPATNPTVPSNVDHNGAVNTPDNGSQAPATTNNQPAAAQPAGNQASGNTNATAPAANNNVASQPAKANNQPNALPQTGQSNDSALTISGIVAVIASVLLGLGSFFKFRKEN